MEIILAKKRFRIGPLKHRSLSDRLKSRRNYKRRRVHILQQKRRYNNLHKQTVKHRKHTKFKTVWHHKSLRPKKPFKVHIFKPHSPHKRPKKHDV